MEKQMKFLLKASLAIFLVGCHFSHSVRASQSNLEEMYYHSYPQMSFERPINSTILSTYPIAEEDCQPSAILKDFNYPQAVLIHSYGMAQGVRCFGGQAVFPLLMHFSPQFRVNLPHAIQHKLTQSGIRNEDLKIMVCAQMFPWKDTAVIGLKPHYAFMSKFPSERPFELSQDIEAGLFDMSGTVAFANADSQFVQTRISVQGDEFDIKPSTKDNLQIKGLTPGKSVWSWVKHKDVLGQPKVILTLHWVLKDKQIDLLGAVEKLADGLDRSDDESSRSKFDSKYNDDSNEEPVLQPQREKAQVILERFLDVLNTLSVKEKHDGRGLQFNMAGTPHLNYLFQFLNLHRPFLAVNNLDFGYVEGKSQSEVKSNLTLSQLKSLYPNHCPEMIVLKDIKMNLCPNNLVAKFDIASPPDFPSNFSYYYRNKGVRFENTQEAHTFQIELPMDERENEFLYFVIDQDRMSSSFHNSSRNSQGDSFDKSKKLEVQVGAVELVGALQPAVLEKMHFSLASKGSLESFPEHSLKGFSPAEPAHRWTEGKKVTLAAPVQGRNVRVKNFLFKDVFSLGDQDVTVTLNDQIVGQYCFNGTFPRHTIEVPFPYDISGIAKIEFLISNPHSPSEGDTRLLGLGFNLVDVTLLTPYEIESYHLGNAENFPFMLEEGFSYPEGKHRWTNGNSAKIRLPLIQKDGRRVQSIIFKDLDGFENQQFLTVKVNGNNQREYVFNGETPLHTIEIPLSNIYGDEAIIEFDIPAAMSPSLVNPELKDDRMIGIAFKRVDLTVF